MVVHFLLRPYTNISIYYANNLLHINKNKSKVGISKRFSSEFKAKVALEAAKLDNNNQIAIKYSLDQKTVRIWRRQLTQKAASLFVERKEELAGSEPVFVWPLTLHNRRIEK